MQAAGPAAAAVLGGDQRLQLRRLQRFPTAHPLGLGVPRQQLQFTRVVVGGARRVTALDAQVNQKTRDGLVQRRAVAAHT